MKLYVTNQENKENNVIEAKKIGDKYYVRSNGGGGGTTYYEIDETRAYDMNRFGEEIKKLFRQLREERAPGSVDEYYMTYHGSSGNIAHGIAEISKQPENYGLKQGEHSYLYLSYSKMDGGHEEGEVLEIGSLKIQDLYTGGNITEDTPYYLFIDEDIKIQNVFIEASCTRPLVFCYFRKAEGEQITYHFHNKTTVIKGILYAPNVKSWVQINNGNYFSGSIVGDKIAIQSQKNSIFEYNVSEVEKWKQGEDGLKFLPEIGFQDSSAPDSGSSSGSGGATVIKEEITLPEGHLNLVLAGSQTDASYYKDSDIEWDDLDK